MNRRWSVIGTIIALCLGIWLGIHIERWIATDACLDAGGAINIERGFHNCQFE